MSLNSQLFDFVINLVAFFKKHFCHNLILMKCDPLKVLLFSVNHFFIFKGNCHLLDQAISLIKFPCDISVLSLSSSIKYLSDNNEV